MGREQHRVLAWLRGLREMVTPGEEVEDVGPVWGGSVPGPQLPSVSPGRRGGNDERGILKDTGAVTNDEQGQAAAGDTQPRRGRWGHQQGAEWGGAGHNEAPYGGGRRNGGEGALTQGREGVGGGRGLRGAREGEGVSGSRDGGGGRGARQRGEASHNGEQRGEQRQGGGRRAPSGQPQGGKLQGGHGPQGGNRGSVGFHPGFTPEALVRAWRVVRANGAGAGVDGVTLVQFEANVAQEVRGLAEALARGEYRPQRVLRVLIPKADGGLRPIGMWTIRDRVVQRALYEVLLPLCEPHFLPCSFGFRPGRGAQQAVAAMAAARDGGQRWVLDADIRECFDSIRRDRVLLALGRWVADPFLMEVTDLFLTARIFNSASGGVEMAGASQGSVLSPLLCNVYLHEFDVAMSGEDRRPLTADGRPPTEDGGRRTDPRAGTGDGRPMVKEVGLGMNPRAGGGGEGERGNGDGGGGWTLVRFADDFVVLGPRKGDVVAAQGRAGAVLGDLRLMLHPGKTAIKHFDQGFKFLGYFFVRGEVYQL